MFFVIFVAKKIPMQKIQLPNLGLFYNVVNMLASGEPLPPQYHDHALIGDRIGLRDCHIENDWVLLYMIKDDILVLTLTDTGTHSDLRL